LIIIIKHYQPASLNAGWHEMGIAKYARPRYNKTRCFIMKSRLFLGVFFSLLGALFYSSQTAIIKLEAGILPPLPVVIFIQSVVALMLILPFIVTKSGVSVFKSKQIGLQILRALFSLAISYSLFYAVQFMPLVNAMLLANTAPFIVPFLGLIFLSQKINHALWIPMFIGFIGVGVVLHPDATTFNLASGLAILAAIAMGVTGLAVRQLSKTDSIETIVFYFFLFSSIASGLFAIPFWKSFDFHMLLILISIGILYFLVQYMMTLALQFVTAQLVMILFYSNIIYAAVISIFVWGVIPSMLTFIGMFLIIVGGILCIHVTHRTQQKQFVAAQNNNEVDYAKSA